MKLSLRFIWQPPRRLWVRPTGVVCRFLVRSGDSIPSNIHPRNLRDWEFHSRCQYERDVVKGQRVVIRLSKLKPRVPCIGLPETINTNHISTAVLYAARSAPMASNRFRRGGPNRGGIR